MATGVHVWSTSAASNSNSDSAINWAEGQAPSSVNDSSRAGMAKVAEYVKDNAGTLTTAGTDTAFTIATPNATFASLAELNGQKLKVRFNATNGAAPTLNVASLGAKAIQTASGTAVATGAILADSVHDVTYDNSIPAFLLSGAFPGSFGSFDGNVTVGGTLGVTGAGTFSSTLAVTGDVAVNTDKLTVAASTGNTAVGGTLGVTGAGTFSSSLHAIGNFAVNTNKFSVVAASGNTAVAGTLAVTGASTLTGALTANATAGVTARNAVKAFGKVVDGVKVAGFNFTGVTDNGASHTITFDTAMADANYAIVLTLDRDNVPVTDAILGYHTVAAGSFRVEAHRPTVSNSVDPDSYSFMVLSNE